MTNPKKDAMIRLIAEELGWTGLYAGTRGTLVGARPNSGSAQPAIVPDWPDSLDAARELEIKDRVKFETALYEIMNATKSGASKFIFYVSETIWSTSEQWCEAYLHSEHGYRWVKCGCDNVDVCNNEYHEIPCLEDHHCPNIMCAGGKFEKEKS